MSGGDIILQVELRADSRRIAFDTLQQIRQQLPAGIQLADAYAWERVAPTRWYERLARLVGYESYELVRKVEGNA
ncbi:hypothetical protein JN531_012640 [Flagellatimonas centrodinii]|uniref:hypothetical protein n=1 Tax=Flagellatimonas centrodinii TaxID=2806210 RepID=UPI001FFDCEE6|nr:hypothetical protein [Flagellatimonas centrodinii]ULQ45947.1 hypothetical protein JN531_012640 [Flagellatimonas centrodinii]